MALFFTNFPNNQFKLKWLPYFLLWQLRRYTERNSWRQSLQLRKLPLCSFFSSSCQCPLPLRQRHDFTLWEGWKPMCDLHCQEDRHCGIHVPWVSVYTGLHCMLLLHCNNFRCACLFSGVARLTYSTAFYFLFSAANNLKLQSFR